MEEVHQMKGNKKALIAAIVLVVVAAILLAVWRFASPRGAAGGKQVTVQVVHRDGSTNDFPLRTQEEYLGPALVEGGVVEDNQSVYGLYILTADGETADEAAQEWWKITKSGEMVNTSADTTPIADGERYELTLTVGYDGF
jgi:preprotein translocase subunit SecF